MKPIVKVENLVKHFDVRVSLREFFMRRRHFLHAVDGIDFCIDPSQIFVLCGESGCGKTTTGLLLCRLETPTAGKILFEGVDVSKLERRELKSFRRVAQMIFQDPYGSLDPRFTVQGTVSEPLKFHDIGSSSDERLELVCKTLEDVGLAPPEEFLRRFPHELSGGEKQRVAIARGLVLQPKFLVADEPVSMVDATTRAGILKVMLQLRENHHLAILFITHDLNVARYIGDKVAIMYVGKIVEVGCKDSVILKPKHPYTQALMSAVPVPDPAYRRQRVSISGEPSSPIDSPQGCRFYPRCPIRQPICKEKEPGLRQINKDHQIACHVA